MKKYFLLISLLGFVLLGLGNYSFASCDNIKADPQYSPFIRGSHTYTCELSAPTNVNCVDPGKTQSCVGPGDGCTTAGYSCCVCDKSSDGTSSPPPQPTAGADCPSPKGGKLNSIGGCSCPTGTKNVNDVCTSCSAPGVCCGVSLNTSVPFIGNCIENSATDVGNGEEKGVTGENAFPVLMGSLTKILITAILILSFVLIVVGGIMIATGNPSGGKGLIMKVVIGIALLGASGVILRLINPNFFG